VRLKAVLLLLGLALTVAVGAASMRGWGIDRLTDAGVSIRTDSPGRNLNYFAGRSHRGGGFRGGK
jgi:hypothetical protein